MKEIIEYSEQEYGLLVLSTLRNMKTVIIDMPVTPQKTVELNGIMIMDDTLKMVWQKEVKEHVRNKKKLQVSLKKLNRLIWGQTSDVMRTKVQAMAKYEDVLTKQDPVELLELI